MLFFERLPSPVERSSVSGIESSAAFLRKVPNHRLNLVDYEYRRVLAFGGLDSAEHDVLLKVNGAAFNAPQLACPQSAV